MDGELNEQDAMLLREVDARARIRCVIWAAIEAGLSADDVRMAMDGAADDVRRRIDKMEAGAAA